MTKIIVLFLDIWLTPPFYMWKLKILYHNLVQKSQLKKKMVCSNLFAKTVSPPCQN